MYNFLYQIVLIFPVYKLFSKMIETFWPISSLCVLNCFKYCQIYISRQMSEKTRQEKLSKELYCFKYLKIVKLF